MWTLGGKHYEGAGTGTRAGNKLGDLPVGHSLWTRIWFNDLWYALPLVIAVSLVYAATRHEAMEAIIPHAVRAGTWIVGFMIAVFLFLGFISLWQ